MLTIVVEIMNKLWSHIAGSFGTPLDDGEEWVDRHLKCYRVTNSIKYLILLMQSCFPWRNKPTLQIFTIGVLITLIHNHYIVFAFPITKEPQTQLSNSNINKKYIN